MGITLGQHPLGKEDMDRLTAEVHFDPDEEGVAGDGSEHL